MSKDIVTQKECSEINKEVMRKIDDVKKDIGDVKLQIAGLPKDLADEFDKRYATKKTEKTVDKVVWIVVVAFVLAVLELILKK